MLDRDVVGDQRQVVAEQRPGGRGELERPLLDEAHHRERGQALRPAGDREPGLDRVGDPVAAVGEPVGLRDTSSSPRSTRTTPENPCSAANASISSTPRRYRLPRDGSRGAARADATHGLVPTGDGWFVLNARDSRWRHAEGPRRPSATSRAKPSSRRSAINVTVLPPGEPMAMYHWEADQEDFLVLAGEALLIIEGEERPLRAVGLRRTARPNAKHVIVGAGARAVRRARGRRARQHSRRPGLGRLHRRRGGAAPRRERRAGDERARKRRYAGLTKREPTRFREGPALAHARWSSTRAHAPPTRRTRARKVVRALRDAQQVLVDRRVGAFAREQDEVGAGTHGALGDGRRCRPWRARPALPSSPSPTTPRKPSRPRNRSPMIGRDCDAIRRRSRAG